MLCWRVVLASTGASAVYPTVWEIFPLETRAMAFSLYIWREPVEAPDSVSGDQPHERVFVLHISRSPADHRRFRLRRGSVPPHDATPNEISQPSGQGLKRGSETSCRDQPDHARACDYPDRDPTGTPSAAHTST